MRTRLAQRLLLTSGMGALADWTVFAALVAVVAQMTGGSVFAVAIVTCTRLVPSVLLGPLLAPYAGVFGIRRTLASVDVVRAGLIASLPLLSSLPTLAAVLLALEFASAISAATRESAISGGIDPDRFTSFNTATAIATYGMLPIGGLLAAALTAAWTPLPFVAAGVLQFASAAVTVLTREIDAQPVVRRADVRMTSGLASVRQPGLLRDTVVAVTLGVVAIGMLFSVGATVATDVFGTVSAYGYLLALLAMGTLIGAWGVHNGQKSASGLFLAAVGSSLLASPLAIAGVVILGVGAGITYVDTQSRLQHVARTPEQFAAAFAVIKIGTVGALILAPVLHQLGGTRLVAAGMVVVAGTGAAWYARRIERRGLATVILTTIARPLLRWAVKVHVVGELPKGGAILASNHPNFLDGPVVMSLDDRVRPVAKPQTLPYIRLALRWSGSLIVGRGTVDAAADYLRAGGVVWLAPEGVMTGRSLGKARSGVARMALQAGVPMVPAGVVYANRRVGPVGTVGPRLKAWRPWSRPQVTVVVGQPVHIAPDEGLDEASERLMQRVSELCNVPREVAEPHVMAAVH